MDEIYIKVIDLGWLGRNYFLDKDIIKVEDLVSLAEDLADEIDNLKRDLENKEELMEQMKQELIVYDPANYS